jgi:hypothetical protein
VISSSYAGLIELVFEHEQAIAFESPSHGTIADTQPNGHRTS